MKSLHPEAMRGLHVASILCHKHDVRKMEAGNLLDHSLEDSLVWFGPTHLGRQGDSLCNRLEERADAELLEEHIILLLAGQYLRWVGQNVAEIEDQRYDRSLPV